MNATAKFKTLLLCSAMLATLWSTDSIAAATGSFERTLSVDEPLVLDVSTGSGTIDISVGSSGRVEISGRIKVRQRSIFGWSGNKDEDLQAFVDLFENEPPVSLSDGRLQVGHVKDKRYGKNVTIDYEIVVPRNTIVESHTGSGAQTIIDVEGAVTASSGSGRIKLSNIGSDVDASTGSGSITADGVAGAFEAHSGSGDVKMTQVAPGDVVVTTGSGSSELQGVVGALRVKAGSGKIVVDGQQHGDWSLDTGSGSVRVRLPSDAAFELDAESGSGGVNIDHPLTVRGKISKRHLRGEVRGGGDLLEIETGSGSIRIEQGGG